MGVTASTARMERPPEVRHFKASTSTLLVRHFHNVSQESVNIIGDPALRPIYGSRARALQVATEILIWQKRPIRLRYKTKNNGHTTSAAYKLLPRTVELINKLTPVYGSKDKVLDACATVIERSRNK